MLKYSVFKKDGTAQGVAKQRLIESLAKPDRRIIYDPYAENFVLGSTMIKIIGHRMNLWLTNKIVPGFHQHLISRARLIDDLVEEKCSEGGIEQYVILGAGYDVRAHRLKLPRSMKVFEVDLAQVQLRKLSKLPRNLPNFENVTYVKMNFNNSKLAKELTHAGYDDTKPTIFTLEGVCQYITKDAFISTLREVEKITKKTEATFFISYVDKLLNENPSACFGSGYHNPKKKVEIIKRLSAKAGEPWISFYSVNEFENILSKHGFSISEDKNVAELNDKYFAPVGRTIPEHEIFKLEHFVVAESNYS